MFMTDKQTEDWLKSQTRDLPMPDGTIETYTTFKNVWHAYDLLTELCGYTATELLGYVREEMDLQSIDFDSAFRCIIGFLDDERRKQMGLL
jgi:hypothetical protein